MRSVDFQNTAMRQGASSMAALNFAKSEDLEEAACAMMPASSRISTFVAACLALPAFCFRPHGL